MLITVALLTGRSLRHKSYGKITVQNCNAPEKRKLLLVRKRSREVLHAGMFTLQRCPENGLSAVGHACELNSLLKEQMTVNNGRNLT